ncbi:MAG: dockerin type I domain-containing protein [Planctomycetota bacterium]|mgnify:CR=1 FL=1
MKLQTLEKTVNRVICQAVLVALVMSVVIGVASRPAFADGRVVVVGPNQGPQPVGPNEKVAGGKTVVVNGEPVTIVQVELMPPKPKFVIGMPLPFPPGAIVYFPFVDDDEGGIHCTYEPWVNSPPGGPDNYIVVKVCTHPGGGQAQGNKMAFPPGAFLIPDPPQPAGLKFMADKFPADPVTESAVLASLSLPNNPWTEVWELTTGDLYFFTDDNPPGPPVQIRPAFLAGDLNCDDSIDALDIQPFVKALLDAAAYATNNPSCGYFYADMNADAAVNVLDVEPFVARLLGT